MLEKGVSIVDTNITSTPTFLKPVANGTAKKDLKSNMTSINSVPYAYKSVVRKCSIKLERCEVIAQMYHAELAKADDQSNNVADAIEKTTAAEPERRYPKRNRVKRFAISAEKTIGRNDKYYEENYDSSENKLDALFSWYTVSYINML